MFCPSCAKSYFAVVKKSASTDTVIRWACERTKKLQQKKIAALQGLLRQQFDNKRHKLEEDWDSCGQEILRSSPCEEHIHGETKCSEEPPCGYCDACLDGHLVCPALECDFCANVRDLLDIRET